MSPPTRELVERMDALTREVVGLRQMVGRIEALECRVGVAPQMPSRDALGNRNVQAGVHTIGPRGIGPTEGY